MNVNRVKDCKLFLTLTLIILSNDTAAQLVTDRPDQTESSSTVPTGSLQIESGIYLEYEDEEHPESQRLLLPTTLFRYGINKRVELRLLNQYEQRKIANDRFSGISDLEIGTKIQLLKSVENPTEIAFLSHLIIPSGSQAISDQRLGTVSKLCLSHQLNEMLALGYNVGYNYFGSGRGDLTYSLSLGIRVNEHAGLYVEPYGEWANMEDGVLNCDAGFTYLATNNLQFDFSFGTGISRMMNYLSFGCSWLIVM